MSDRVTIPFAEFLDDPTGSFQKVAKTNIITMDQFVSDTIGSFEKTNESAVVITDTVDGEERTYLLRRVRIAEKG